MVSSIQPDLSITQISTPSQHQGMGSIVFDGGTAFRVWAPFAKKIHVAFYADENQADNKPT
ncbi:MAG: hypothetical protein HC862_22550 [Scytonema sp. RU_4_4]|nr:hypothetical protein [Scytonema sp. RU_4_4]